MLDEQKGQKVYTTRIQLKNLSDTEKLGRLLGAAAGPGESICLDGDLGAGKTTLSQAIARGLGVPENCYVTSPSFAILHEYEGRMPMYHMDFYRLQGVDEVLDLGFDEYFYLSGLTVIEWSKRAIEILPEERLTLEMAQGSEGIRTVIIQATANYRQRVLDIVREFQGTENQRYNQINTMNIKSVHFSDCLKKFTIDQDKAIAPEETLRKFYAKVDALNINILNEVKRIDNGRLNIPVYFSICGEDAKTLTGTKKQMGKGASPIQAEASACMELAERFSFFSYKNNSGNFLTGDYAAMIKAGHPVLAMEYLLTSVHDSHSSVELLRQLLEDIPMQWVWATNITRGEDVLMPFSWFFAINEFNGPSAGNTLEEAAMQGICEIVERHVCSLINNRKLITPRIDTASIEDEVARELLHKFNAHNIELYLNDFSLDTGICTVGALAIDRSTFPEKSEIVYTAGTTPDPEKALIRAITEVAQLAGDFNTASNYVASGLPKPLAMEEVEYVTNSPESVTIGEMSKLADNNIRVEIDNCIAALKKIGMEIFMIDVTHDDLQIPALYTIVPGAHFRERSMIKDVGLFAAKLLVELVQDSDFLEKKLRQMEALLPAAYYLEFYRGRNFSAMGLPESALEHFNRALALQPEPEDLPYILSYMGSCLKDLGKYEEAVTTLYNGLAADEERPDIHNTLGVCFFKTQQYEKAIDHFHRAVVLNPASGIDYANLGVNYHKIGNKESAVQFLSLALTLDPSLDFADNLLVEITGK